MLVLQQDQDRDNFRSSKVCMKSLAIEVLLNKAAVIAVGNLVF